MKNCGSSNFKKIPPKPAIIKEQDENSIAVHNCLASNIERKIKKCPPTTRNPSETRQNDKQKNVYNGCFLYNPEKIGNSIIRPRRPRLPKNATFLPPRSKGFAAKSSENQNFDVCNSIDSCLYVLNS